MSENQQSSKIWLSDVKSNPARMFFLQWSRGPGEMMYSFVSVPEDKLPEFKQKLEDKSPFDLEDYGVIVRWGHGKPDEKVLKEMKDEFDFEVEV